LNCLCNANIANADLRSQKEEYKVPCRKDHLTTALIALKNAPPKEEQNKYYWSAIIAK
jgi:hypothetical protein